jgi:single-strand DNA-binding protein
VSDQNAYHFTGRLTRDIQLSYTPSGIAVADVGVAIGRKYKEKEEVVFLDLRIWGVQAETWNKYFRKGSFVIASGRLMMDQWTGQDGAKRSKLRCVIEDFTFPPRAQPNNAALPSGGKDGQGRPPADQPGEQPPAGENYDGDAGVAPHVPDNDIPF